MNVYSPICVCLRKANINRVNPSTPKEQFHLPPEHRAGRATEASRKHWSKAGANPTAPVTPRGQASDRKPTQPRIWDQAKERSARQQVIQHIFIETVSQRVTSAYKEEMGESQDEKIKINAMRTKSIVKETQ